MGIAQALADDAGVVGNGDFGIVDIWMPELFPFETVEALISNGTQSLDLALDRDVPRPVNT